MCKTPVALHNSTHIGPNQNAAIINSWWLFSSYTVGNRSQHHALHSNMYTWAVLWIVMVVIGLIIATVWLCKGPIFWCCSRVLFKVINTHVEQQDTLQRQPSMIQQIPIENPNPIYPNPNSLRVARHIEVT